MEYFNNKGAFSALAPNHIRDHLALDGNGPFQRLTQISSVILMPWATQAVCAGLVDKTEDPRRPTTSDKAAGGYVSYLTTLKMTLKKCVLATEGWDLRLVNTVSGAQWTIQLMLTGAASLLNQLQSPWGTGLGADKGTGN